MTPEQVRKIVQEEVRKVANTNRFGLQAITRHTHNGFDSPPIYSPTITYAGFVPYTAGQNVGFLLPTGWSVQLNGDNSYTIFHNLNTFAYSFVTTPAQSTNQPVFPIYLGDDVGVTLGWLDVDDPFGGFKQTSFSFSLTQINNKRSPIVNYDARDPQQS